MILHSPSAGVVFRDSGRATRYDPVRSNSPAVKTKDSAMPVIANIPCVPASLFFFLAERVAPASLALKSQMRHYLKVPECDEVPEYLRVSTCRLLKACHLRPLR
jgi:hypothetical protein